MIMKLAIMLYGTRVSPRYGYSQGVLIVEVSNQGEFGRKTLEIGKYYPEKIPEILSKEGVEVVISGGMNQHFQNLFRLRGIDVIWGIIGEADDVLAAFMSGRLSPGMGCCLTRLRRRQGQKRFRGRGYIPKERDG
jgi:predicted Fe-Mo cluster-binding NifX family protein